MQLLDKRHWLVSDFDRVWRTVDGGRTWSMVYRSRAEGEMGQHIRGLSFIDERTGYLIDEGSLLKTSDGGGSWHEVGRVASGKLEFEASSCHFIDEMRGWAVGIIWTSDFVSRPGVPMYVGGIMRTGDGGKSWREQEISLPAGHFEEEGVRWDLDDVYFIDERRGWAVGSGVIFWTEDGGEHWQVAEAEGWDFKRVTFLDNQFGWVTERQGPELSISRDGGHHWEALDGPPRYGSWPARVIFLNRKRGWALVAGSLYKTVDAGDHRSEAKRNPFTGEHGRRRDVGGKREVSLVNMGNGATWEASGWSRQRRQRLRGLVPEEFISLPTSQWI